MSGSENPYVGRQKTASGENCLAARGEGLLTLPAVKGLSS